MTAEPSVVPCLCVLLVLLVLPGACGAPIGDPPNLFEVQPSRILEHSSVVLRMHGDGFPPSTPLVVLRGGHTLALRSVSRVSDHTILGAIREGIGPGMYDLQVSFPGRAPLLIEEALVVEPMPSGPQDRRGPMTWLTYPDPSLGLRAGSRIWLEILAEDESRVAEIGYVAEGLVEAEESREVSSGGARAWTRFAFEVPAELEPLQLFWVIPNALDRHGNLGISQLAYSMVICGDTGGSSPDWPCQN